MGLSSILGILDLSKQREDDIRKHRETIKERKMMTFTINNNIKKAAILLAVDLEELQVPEWVDDEAEDAVEM